MGRRQTAGDLPKRAIDEDFKHQPFCTRPCDEFELFSGRDDALEKPSLPESAIQGRVVVPDSVAGARSPVGIRRPKRVWEWRQQARFSSVPGDYIPHHSNQCKRNTCANRARYLDGQPVYRNSPLSGQPIMEPSGREWQSNPGYGHQSQHFGRELDEARGEESNASHQEKNEQNDEY
jgi:hypothetical protein